MSENNKFPKVMMVWDDEESQARNAVVLCQNDKMRYPFIIATDNLLGCPIISIDEYNKKEIITVSYFKHAKPIPEKKKRWMTPREAMDFCLDKRPMLKDLRCKEIEYCPFWFYLNCGNDIPYLEYLLPDGTTGKLEVEE